MKFLLSLCVLSFCSLSLVDSLGLREEFTWSRISYEWPNGRRIRETEMEGSYGRKSSREEGGRYGSSRPSMYRPGSTSQGGGSYQPHHRPTGGMGETGDSFGCRGQQCNNQNSGGGDTNFEEQTSGGSFSGINGPSNLGGGSSQGNRGNGHHSTSGINNQLDDDRISNVGSDYIYANNIPMGANVWKDKLFITVPRRRLGVPSTLNYVSLSSSKRHNVPLIPYPDWETNTLPRNNESERIVSVYRVAVDPCDRLWFVDTGLIEIPNSPQRIFRDRLIIIDLKTDKVIGTYEFPSDVIKPATQLASLTIDVTPDQCREAYAYLPDLGGYGLIVFSLRENRSWRITHNFFYLEPNAGEFRIAGHSFQWNDGVFSVALSEKNNDGYRDLYFHSMAGTHLYSVSTRILRNHTLATRSYHNFDFKVIGDRGRLSQTSSSDLHKPTGVLFLALVNQNAVGCWNIKSPLEDISVVQKDDKKMIYPSDVKVYKDDLIVLTNTMPQFLYGTLNYDQTNFRVWIENVSKAIQGTKCAGSRRGVSSYTGGSSGSKGGNNRYGGTSSGGNGYRGTSSGGSEDVNSGYEGTGSSGSGYRGSGSSVSSYRGRGTSKY